jgi:predicted nucleic acid-binding protein
MWEHHPDPRPVAGEREEELRRGVEVLRACTETMRPHGARDPRWGAMRPDEFAAAQEQLLRSGTIRRRHDVETLFTTAHVDAFNAFDPRRVYKVIRRDVSEERAVEAVAALRRATIAPVDESLALEAADLSFALGLAMAASLVYATARRYGARLVTGDADFQGLPGAVVVR